MSTGTGTGAHSAHAGGHEDGNSVAAWTAVSIITLGFIVGGVALWVSSVAGFYVGVGLCVLGVIVGKVLAMMGFGVSRPGEPVESAAAAD
jgi:hypothetical protein